MTSFMNTLNGPLSGLMQWQQWENLLATITASNDGRWYFYDVGETPPEEPLETTQLPKFLTAIDKLIREEHQESFLGIVYADNPDQPSLIRIYDPNSLGSVCGSSQMRVLPGWVISRYPPVDLQAEFPKPGNRRRWWKQLFA